MLRFQLFRLKVVKPSQMRMFISADESPESIVKAAMLEKPTAKLFRGYSWHIGNLVALDESSFYFALGRSSSTKSGRYNMETREFEEQEFETAPYTHVLLDFLIGLCAIASNPLLAPRPEGIARQYVRLLATTQTAQRRGVRFEISDIKDPEEFISQIRRAYAIRWFATTFTLPNPFDVNKDFQLPMERLLSEANGSRGRTSISGADLNSGILEELTRSSAATGNNAQAKIVLEKDQEPILRQLKGNVASIEVERVDSTDDKRGLLGVIRQIYNRIRHHQEGSRGK